MLPQPASGSMAGAMMAGRGLQRVGGMLAACDDEAGPLLQALATADRRASALDRQARCRCQVARPTASVPGAPSVLTSRPHLRSAPWQAQAGTLPLSSGAPNNVPVCVTGTAPGFGQPAPIPYQVQATINPATTPDCTPGGTKTYTVSWEHVMARQPCTEVGLMG